MSLKKNLFVEAELMALFGTWEETHAKRARHIEDDEEIPASMLISHRLAKKRVLSVFERCVDAIADGKRDTLVELLDAHPDVVSEVNGYGYTLLHEACYLTKDYDVFVAVASRYVSMDLLVRSGMSPLMLAIREGAPSEIIMYLLTRGARFDCVAKTGETIMHSIVLGRHPELLEFFVKRGVSLDLVDKTRCTPLHWAVRSRKTLATDILLRLGASTEIKNAVGHTPLFTGIAHDSVECTRLLMQAGANLDVRDARNVSSYSQIKSPEMLKVFFE